MLKFAFCLGPFTLLFENRESTIAIVSGYRDCCIAVSLLRLRMLHQIFSRFPFEIAIVYSDFQRVQNFFYRDVPGSVKIAITVSLGVNYFSTSPVLCPDLLPSLDCNYGISIVASRPPLWFPYCVSDYCKMVSLLAFGKRDLLPYNCSIAIRNVLRLLYHSRYIAIVLYCDGDCCIVIKQSWLLPVAATRLPCRDRHFYMAIKQK